MSWMDDDFNVDLNDQEEKKQVDEEDLEDQLEVKNDEIDPETKKKLKNEIKEKKQKEKEKQKKKEEEKKEKVKMLHQQTKTSVDHLKRLQEENDFEKTKDLFSMKDQEKMMKNISLEGLKIDSFEPEVTSDFFTLARLIGEKTLQYQNNINFKSFMGTLIKEITKGVRIDLLSELSTTMNRIRNDAIKNSKQKKKKTTSKAKVFIKTEDPFNLKNAYNQDDSDDDNTAEYDFF
ncbi:eukaryotic translation initiation factor 3 subunit j [Anaeramoeba flamelloides]|uniref:Eukaryotic translation initiation factor 3 subunit j n=1 Tax=Anaeramoeba flamelloides TaxID=1746091 RepID=A0AAV7Z3I5_9EUKA|nr:eukaryotic translation initiation factor 3 subunit j [Anaeramoeba flamelloides]